MKNTVINKACFFLIILTSLIPLINFKCIRCHLRNNIKKELISNTSINSFNLVNIILHSPNHEVKYIIGILTIP